MIKSFGSLASLTSIILVLAHATESAESEISSTFGHVSRDVNDYDDELNPNIGCMLFGDVICKLYCAFNIDVYYIEINTNGSCDENNYCACSYEVDGFFPHNWYMKFNSDYVLWAVKRNLALFQLTVIHFLIPFKTAKQIKKILHPYLSPYEYHKLIIKDDTIAHEFFENGQVNKQWVIDYVSDKIEYIFESSKTEKHEIYVNYEQNFRNALENVHDEGTLYNIAFDLRSIQNEKLDNIWREHLTKNQLEQPNIDLDYPKGLIAHLYHAITNEIIKQRDAMEEDPAIVEAANSALKSDEEDEKSFWWNWDFY